MSETYGIVLSGEMMTDPNACTALKAFLNDCAEASVQECHQLEMELGVTEACACDIQYLRTRSRWTEELEEELISLYRAGTPPNIFEFGNKVTVF